MRRIPLIHLFVLLAACEASAADPSVTFTVLPGFGEIDPQGQHLGSLSGNGVVVVGFGSSRNQGVRGEAPCRWTRRDGITSLQPEVRDFQSGLATGVSYDGDVIVGTVTLDQYGNVPFVWTEVDGFRYLDFTGEFYDISDEGTAVGKWTPDGESVARYRLDGPEAAAEVLRLITAP